MVKILNTNEFLHGGDYNPEQWLGSPEVINEDFALFKRADINTVTVGIFSWAKLEPEEGKYDFKWLDDIFDRVEKENGHVILATPSGARPAWLAQKYPEVLRTNEYGIKMGFGVRHNHCLTSPIYRKKVREIDTELAKHFGKRSSLILWHISNEFSGECYCELCQQAFRDWLKNKYQTLDNLNHAWWNTFWSHTFTDWNQITAPSPRTETSNKGMDLDWKRFITDQTISFIENEKQTLNEITPDIPVTTNFMASNPHMNPFQGLDYQKIAKHLDVISWDSYPCWGNDYQSTEDLGRNVGLIHDFFRSLKHQNFMIMENTPSRVNWAPIDRAKRPGMHELSSLQDIAHGSDSVCYFQLRASRGSAEMFHGAVLEHLHPDKTRVYKDVCNIGDKLQRIKTVFGSDYAKAKVAIVYSYDNSWALDDAESYMKNKKLWQTVQKHYRYFYDHDIPVDIISPDDDLKTYKLIIDPMHFLMSRNYMNSLKDYVENGGDVVGTYISGIVDENCLAYMNEWPRQLQDIYGVEPTETDVLYPKQENEFEFKDKTFKAHDFCQTIDVHSAKVIGKYQSDFYNDTAAITQNKLGKGVGYYLACRTNYDFLADFYRSIVKELKLNEIMPINKSSNKISIQIRKDPKHKYYFVQNFSHDTQEINLTKELMELLSDQKEKGISKLSAYGTKVFCE